MKKFLVTFLFVCLILTACSTEESVELTEPMDTDSVFKSTTEFVTDVSTNSDPKTDELSVTELVTEAPTDATEEPATQAHENYEDVGETVYATTDVNVRSGPGTEYEKVGRIPKGGSVTCIEEGNNGWSKVIYEGNICYISSKYLTTIGATATATTSSSTESAANNDNGYTSVNETVYATTDVNVRSGPGTEYEKIGRISAGQAITRIGVGNDGWSKVMYDGNTCYVSSNYLSTAKPSSETKTEMVWISGSGTKYHSKSSCSNMKNPSQIAKDTAISRGYKACSKCY